MIHAPEFDLILEALLELLTSQNVLGTVSDRDR